VGLPDRDTKTAAPPRPACAGGVQWRLTCTGLWTERRTCPRSQGRLLGAPAKSACAWRTLTTFPSSFFQRTPVVIGAYDCLGRAPCRRYGPTKACTAPSTREGCRHPADQGAFHRCDRARMWIAPPRLPASVPRSRRPHVLPMAGDNVLLRTLQASPPALPGGDIRGAGRLCYLADTQTRVGSCEPSPGTDDPSEPTWLGLRGLWREL